MNKFEMYMESVQDARAEVDFIGKAYRHVRGRRARVLREDFCGTGAVSCAWATSAKDRRAFGIDLDAPTLKWGERLNRSRLDPKTAARVQLLRGDVLDRTPFKADCAAALNFSYFIFKKRADMLRYARGVRAGLARDGIFVLDIYGGPDAQILDQEETRHGPFTYIWDQAAYNPVTGDIRCHIHFRLKGGRMIRKAFTYDWRLWGMPEMKDILLEAGFEDVIVYWEGTNRKTGEGNGTFRQSVRGDDSACWVSYIVAVK